MDIEKEIYDWHVETFPNATDRAIFLKLGEEVEELIDVINKGIINEHIVEEAADIFIVASSFCSRVLGVSLLDIVADKMVTNKKRQWGKEDENGDRPREKK